MLHIPDDLAPDTVAVLGLPTDESSSFLRGPAMAPARIRSVLHDGAANLCTEDGHDLGREPRFRDLGDLDVGAGAATRSRIEEAVTDLLERGTRVLSLGGDHAVTYPILRGYATQYDTLNILHLDAHPDLYDTFDGNRYSHGCPFARIMEEGLAVHLVQVGIRTATPHQRAQAERFGVETIEMKDWHPDLRIVFDGPVYLSLDMDALDPAFAPGVSHHEPGGFSTRDVLGIIQQLDAPLVGADIVEFNPVRDPVGTTGMAAAKLLKEIAAKMLGAGD